MIKSLLFRTRCRGRRQADGGKCLRCILGGKKGQGYGTPRSHVSRSCIPASDNMGWLPHRFALSFLSHLHFPRICKNPFALLQQQNVIVEGRETGVCCV